MLALGTLPYPGWGLTHSRPSGILHERTDFSNILNHFMGREFQPSTSLWLRVCETLSVLTIKMGFIESNTNQKVVFLWSAKEVCLIRHEGDEVI